MNYVYYSDHLEHHGILGQKWGIRRFQNEDGTWTAEGRKRRYQQQNNIATGLGVAAGLAVGVPGAIVGNPAAVAGSALVGAITRDSVRSLMRSKDGYAIGQNNYYSGGYSTKQTKKLNKKLMNNPDYLTSLKDNIDWMPSTSTEYKKENNKFLRDTIKKNEDLHKFMKENYGDSPDKIENHLKRSMRGLNEASEIESQSSGELFTGQIYNNMTNMYSKGWIDKQTFDNFYDSALANQCSVILDNYDVSQPHYQQDLKAIIDKGDRLYSQNKKNNVGRLDNWFSEDPDRNPERTIKHYCYTQNYFIS